MSERNFGNVYAHLKFPLTWNLVSREKCETLAKICKYNNYHSVKRVKL